MTVELTVAEAELVIAMLKFAEDASVVNPAVAAAMADLRHWRSALLQAYLRERLAITQ